jgi:hypothetical protein
MLKLMYCPKCDKKMILRDSNKSGGEICPLCNESELTNIKYHDLIALQIVSKDPYFLRAIFLLPEVKEITVSKN